MIPEPNTDSPSTGPESTASESTAPQSTAPEPTAPQTISQPAATQSAPSRPAAPQAAAAAPGPVYTPAPAPAPTEPSGPRTGPIVWGALILGFCGYVLQRTLAPGDLDTTTWITAVTIGLGLLLLGVGAAVLIRNHRRANRLANRRTTR
ncbi:hypothetical protein MUN76_06795 [Leucobacter rhizosphaerae]|uniref:LPXTG cell wall anchor domain-containing protein n=1 Tax=Leucobacter rhizosphaerae TaxID=2932245 RepID=A0ABY4FZU2_9MICO|nr:hypothetical protein [Leucobacter rhizosphaerae]UOQ61659.1 hypothetical protein MUN76_06795 [Leucobacter rhizosphaerae]